MPGTQQWEYQIVAVYDSQGRHTKMVYPLERDMPRWSDFNVALDQFGTQGWELTGVAPSFTSEGQYVYLQLFFKRAKAA